MQREPGSHECSREAGSDVPRYVAEPMSLALCSCTQRDSAPRLPGMQAQRKDLRSHHLLWPQELKPRVGRVSAIDALPPAT